MGGASLPAPYAGTPLDTERRNPRWGAWRLAGDAAECARDRERRTPPTQRDHGRVLFCANTACTPWRGAGAADLHGITLAGVWAPGDGSGGRGAEPRPRRAGR